MAEELYFFKFDKDKARNILTQMISTIEPFSYQCYLEDESVNYNHVYLQVENDVEHLSSEELWSLYTWFSEKHEVLSPKQSYSELEKTIRSDMFDAGLDLFFEIPSKTPVRKFHELLRDYEHHSKQELELTCSQNQFAGFLNYLICYTGSLQLLMNKDYYEYPNNHKENVAINALINSIPSTDYCHDFARTQIELEKKDYLKTIAAIKQLIQFRRTQLKQNDPLPKEFAPIAKQERNLINKASILYLGIELKEKLSNYKGLITRLHSY